MISLQVFRALDLLRPAIGVFQRHPVAATPSTGARSESYEARRQTFRPIPGTLLARETIDEVEALIKSKTRNKVRIHLLEERVGDSIAFLSYSIDDKNQKIASRAIAGIFLRRREVKMETPA
jgi:hypothetical protein